MPLRALGGSFAGRWSSAQRTFAGALIRVKRGTANANAAFFLRVFSAASNVTMTTSRQGRKGRAREESQQRQKKQRSRSRAVGKTRLANATKCRRAEIDRISREIRKRAATIGASGRFVRTSGGILSDESRGTVHRRGNGCLVSSCARMIRRPFLSLPRPPPTFAAPFVPTTSVLSSLASRETW